MSAARARLHPVDTPVDLVLALALAAATQAEIWAPGLMGADQHLTHRPALSVLALVICLPLVWRRALPWAVAGVGFAGEVLQGLVAEPADGLANLLTMLVIAYSLGRYAARPAGYAGGALVAATAFGVGADLADHVFVLIVLGAAWVAGLVLARRADDLGALELRRLAASREAADAERLRIARELHDVVAHRVSLIVVQSQLADSLIDTDRAAAHDAVRTVEAAGRAALSELRSVLGLLHEDTDARRAPGDTDLERLDGLVEEARAGGLPVTLAVEGQRRSVPPAVALAAFRIVQESLTNVVRHADAASTRIGLVYGPTQLQVLVENEGPPVSSVVAGHGLTGMAERASFLGGSLVAEPRPEGGFRVLGLLPTPESET